MQDVPLSRTPDFYSYAEAPPDSVGLADDVVALRWADGARLDAYGLWLFENQMNDVTIEERTREAKIDPAELPIAPVVMSAHLADSGDLEVGFLDGRVARYHSGWLRHVADGQAAPDAFVAAHRTWTPNVLSEPPTFDGQSVKVDDQALLDFLTASRRFGIARLENLGTDTDDLPTLGARIGALRDTNFGTTWPVSVDIAPTSTANTPLPLPPHTDLPTRETPPGFQLLHCIKNTCNAGLSTMADGYAVVDHLRSHEPEQYEALTTLRWTFFNRSPEHDHRWSGPIIDRGGPGVPLTLRAFHPVRGFPAMAIEDQPRAYAALRVFSQVAASDEFQMRYPFKPGDLVMFDNRRILHGRTAIDAAGGQRVLRGTYIDHDEVYSRLRVLARKLFCAPFSVL